MAVDPDCILKDWDANISKTQELGGENMGALRNADPQMDPFWPPYADPTHMLPRRVCPRRGNISATAPTGKHSCTSEIVSLSSPRWRSKVNHAGGSHGRVRDATFSSHMYVFPWKLPNGYFQECSSKLSVPKDASQPFGQFKGPSNSMGNIA